jgi:nitrate/TMAO reductase-like tetraheme cytochrome c subunit
MLARALRPIQYFSRHPLMMAGAVLTTSSAFTMIGFWAMELLFQSNVHPYAGIILFVALPAVFVLGLLLIPVGAFLARHRTAAAAHVDLGSPDLRVAAMWVALATGVNIVLLSFATYRGVAYMDSTQFCGMTCHSVMAPQYAAYLGSPHSRVSCTECHIGPGASWFVKSKLSGARQLFAVAFETHSRPIPSPVHDLRPSRETCEHCHWPQKFHGDRLVVRRRFDNDEANTPLTTVLLMKVGGHTAAGGVGIHGKHLDPADKIAYVATDDKRQVIPNVTLRGEGGKEEEFVSTEIKTTAEELAKGERRTMDCIDCHNRPTHAFEMPERAVDKAIEEGRISRDLPFVKKTGVALLRTEYADRETAAQRIDSGLAEFYRANHPDVHRQKRGQIQAASEQLQGIYKRNVFPNMKVTWGTYPNHIGHSDFMGCFRCHDESHKNAAGRTISQDCTSCHAILASDEKDPKILADLGVASP